MSSQAPARGLNLLGLASKLAQSGHEGSDWFRAIEEADTRDLIHAIGAMGATGTIGVKYDALRDSARSMVEQKLTERMIEKMEALERVSTRLGRIGVFLALAAIAVAILQLVGA